MTDSLPVFLLITVLFMGGCAVMTGQALAAAWRLTRARRMVAQYPWLYERTDYPQYFSISTAPQNTATEPMA